MEINAKMKFFGHYNIVVENQKTKEVRTSGWQSNLVLKQLFTAFSHNQQQRLYLLLGTGSTTPTVDDTGLDNPVASITGSYRMNGDNLKTFTDFAAKTRNFEHSGTFSAATGAVQGNISEIGLTIIPDLSLGRYVFTRTLIKDENGDPTTITLGEFDKVTVHYSHGWVLPLDGLLMDTTFDYKGVPTRAIAKFVDWESPNQDVYNTTSSWNWDNSFTESGGSANQYSYGMLPEKNGTGGRQLDCGEEKHFFGGVDAVAIDESHISTLSKNDTVYPHFGNFWGAGYEVTNTDSAKSFSFPDFVLEAGTYTGNLTGICFTGGNGDTNTVKRHYGFTWGIFFYPPLDKQASDKLTFSNVSINFQVS